MKINLHTHSNYSLDGEFDVQYLIKYFKDNNFDIISITDHDTCEAYKHIHEDPNIKIITGMEADAIVNNHTYDFLCYDFKFDEVYKYAKEKYQSVDKRQRKIFNSLIEKAKTSGITLSNVDAYDSRKEYAHAAIYRMLDEKFLERYNIKSIGDLYRISTIDSTFPLYIDMHIVWPDIKELLEVIHKNDGKVFIAHPYRYNKDVVEVLDEVKEYVDGIEICNNPNSKDEVEYLYKYAKDNNLLVSCGSDYHGNSRYDLECKYLTEDMINDILLWLDYKNINKYEKRGVNMINDYDKFAKERQEMLKKGTKRPHRFIEKPMMRDLLPNLTGKKVLMLGCGTGEESIMLQEFGAIDITGIDLSEESIRLAQESYPSCKFIAGDMHKLPFEDDEFDFVYSSLAIHYSETPENVYKEIYRVLKKDGELLFSIGHPLRWACEEKTIDGVNCRVIAHGVDNDNDVEIGNYNTFKKHDHYFKNGEVLSFYVGSPSFHFKLLNKVRFIVEDFSEGICTDEAKDIDYNYWNKYHEIPQFMAFLVKK